MWDVEVSLEGTRFRLDSERWGSHEVRIPLVGAHQARNAALAAELLGVLPDDVRPSWEAIEAGFADVRWAGRMQVVRQRGATWIFDVAHNPAGVAALVDTLDGLDLPRPLVLVAAILSDKEWDEMLPPLLARADAAILTIAPTAPGVAPLGPGARRELPRRADPRPRDPRPRRRPDARGDDGAVRHAARHRLRAHRRGRAGGDGGRGGVTGRASLAPGG